MKRLALLLAMAVVLSACGHHHSEEHEGHEHESHEHEGHSHGCGHDHDHGTALQLTSYSADYEIFAEVSPLSVGNQSELRVHVTRLSDFRPLHQGKLKATLSVGNQSVSATGEVETLGIFHLHIQPTTAGKATLTLALNDTATFELKGLTVFEDAHEAEHDAEHRKVSSPTGITFTKEQSWQVDFATAQPQVIDFGQVVQTVAQVQSAQGDEITVVAKTSGTLHFNASNIFEGTSVSQGTSLFSVSSQGFVDDNLGVRLSEAKNNYETAKQNYERAKSLVDSKIVSEQEFMERKNTYENAKAVYENLKTNFSGSGSAITAPMSGFVKQVFVANGEYVSVGQPVMTISQNKNLVLKADIPQRYATMLTAISSANIEDPVSRKVYSLEELNGRVVSYAKSLTPNNLMLPVTLEIRNIGDFTSGAFVNVWLKGNRTSKSLVVPKTSLIEEQGNYYVFVQITPELFEKQAVTIGVTDGKSVEILSGLRASQRVVTRGAVLVKLAKGAAALDPHAGHVH